MNEAAPESPIQAAILELRSVLVDHHRAVLVAPPGTGKTTRVPLALLVEPWLDNASDPSAPPARILMLEPRRIAARAAAEYMSALANEPVGRLIGYRTRGDTKVSDATRVEVITERLLTRRLQRDPELSGVALVIFDEIHERSLDTDLGLALCLDVAASLRPDLRVLAMSATPDIAAISSVLSVDGSAPPIVTSDSVTHEITTTYVGRDARRRLDEEVAHAVVRALHDTERTGGDVLVFMPGRREIRFAAERLASLGVATVPLTAGLDAAALNAALRPDPSGTRKVVLATSVAQTSLTIDGVRVVVDAGLERSASYDPSRGMGGLVTVAVSRAAADQRRGRAGRQAPGQCYRMWSPTEETHRRAQSEPEVTTADLTQLALDVAAWGVSDPGQLRWITPPPSVSWDAAVATLRELDAIADNGRITSDGRQIADLGAHPRLGRMMLNAAAISHADLGALLAATVEAGTRGDLCRAVERPDREVERVAKQLLRRIPSLNSPSAVATTFSSEDEAIGALVAAAFPERVARRRDGTRDRYLTAAGIGVTLDTNSSLAGADWLAISEVERSGSADDRVISGAHLFGKALDEHLEARINLRTEVQTSRDGVISASSNWNLGSIVVRPAAHERADPAAVIEAATKFVAERGVAALRWSDTAHQLQSRIAFVRRFAPDVPDCSDTELAQWAATWLPRHHTLTTNHRGEELRLGDINAIDVIIEVLGWKHRAQVDSLAPIDLVTPSGRRHRIDYESGEPVVRVKLQEMFGSPATPRIADGRAPITLHLLSPAGRPVQVTQDLASFWSGAYGAVRSELRGRYPRHPWPEDPTTAVPTANVKRRRP